MGGKVWSSKEQDYFISTVMPLSQFNGKNGVYDPKSGHPWEYLAGMMQAVMNRRGLARRIYNKSMLYQHWYQTIKKTWGEDHAKMLRDSAPRSARGDAGKLPRSRAKETKQRAKEKPAEPPASMESNSRANGPGTRKDAVSGRYRTERPYRASNYPRLDEFSASSKSSHTRFQGHNTPPARYHGTSMTSDLPPSGQFNPYGASEAPYLTHAEGAELYRQQLSRRPELQRARFQPVNENQRDPATPASFNQPFNHHHRRRQPTPEEDDADESSLFVQASEQELHGRMPAPKTSIELDAAYAMTMLFREQEPHILHHAPRSPRPVSAPARRNLMREHPYDRQAHARLAPMIPREYAPHQGQNQGQLEEDGRR